jgi:hypothetical protein
VESLKEEGEAEEGERTRIYNVVEGENRPTACGKPGHGDAVKTRNRK